MPNLFFYFMDIIVYILATFRIAILLANEKGPCNILDRLRSWLGVQHDDVGLAYGTNAISKGIICIWCNSIWVALGWLIVKLLLPEYALYLAFSFAISGGAIFVYEVLEWLGQTRQRS